MSIGRGIPDKPELSVIDGGGDPDAGGRSMLDRARAAVASVFTHGPDSENPYGHLAPVPPSPAEQADDPAQPEVQAQPQPGGEQPGSVPSAENVVPITAAPTYEARRILSGAESGSALTSQPVPVDAEGEIDARYARIKEARLEVEASHHGVHQPEPSQIEDLFKH